MTKGMLSVLLGGMLVAAATAVAASRTKSSGVICTLTGETVPECCCKAQKGGKLYCTLAETTVDPCCCKPAEE